MACDLDNADRLLDLSKSQVMGILNVTPDSFYAGSRMTEVDTIAARVRQIVDEGAAIVDIGAYSSRPGAQTVTSEEEMKRLRFGLDIYALKTEPLQSDLFGEGLSVELNGKPLLQIGTVSPKIRRRTDVKQEVYYLEMNFEALCKSTKKLKITAEELSKYPEVKRDLALLVDRQKTTFAQLREAAFAAERKLLKRVSLFDVYEGDKLPEGKKSYALSFVLEDKSRTLDDKTIERVMSNLTRQFEQRCGATVRA